MSATASEPVAIGINGFGRIGRAVLRAALGNPLVRVTAINDPFVTPEAAAYLVRHDTTYGNAGISASSAAAASASGAGGGGGSSVEVRRDSIVLDGAAIAIHQKSEPAAVPWSDSRVVYVVECSGVFSTQERAGAHLAGGAARVVVTGPSSDAPTFVAGVNVAGFRAGTQVIAAGSCTGAVLAPALRALHEAFGLEEATFVSVHAATSAQRAVDGVNAKDRRLGRAVLNNIVPHGSGAARTLLKVLPALAPRVLGTSYHVPVLSGCALDLTVRLTQHVAPEAVAQLFREPPPAFRDVLAHTADELVSSDVDAVPAGRRGAAVFDAAAAGALGPATHKLLLWYSNELGYASRVLDLILATNKVW